MTSRSISIALVIGSGSGPIPGPERPESVVANDSGPDLEHWWSVLNPLFDECMLVCPEPRRHLNWRGLILQAGYLCQEPLEAVQAALLAARNPQVLMTDPQWPFISAAILAELAALAEPRWDVVAVDPGDGKPPIPVIFHKRCLKMVDRHLTPIQLSLERFLRQVRVHTVALTRLTPAAKAIL